MAIRGSRYEEQQHDLNLAPIMNMVMILIPLLLITASFVVVQSLNVSSPRHAQSVTPEEQEDPEEVPVPRVLVAITEEGFTIQDMRQSPAFSESGLGFPTPECGGSASLEAGVAGPAPVTICVPPSRATEEDLLSRLDYRGLYNRLVEIKNHSAWAAQWDENNQIINLVADGEIPFEVVVRTMDISRFLLQNDRYDNDEAFHSAIYREEGEGQYVELFPNPVLLLPRPTAN